MNYEELLKDMENYRDTMTDEERLTAYFKGKEVDRIPFNLMELENSAPLYGYTVGEFRRDINVQCEVMGKLGEEFGYKTIPANLGLKAIGEAAGSILEYPEEGIDFIKEYILDDYEKLDSMKIVDPYKDGSLPATLKRVKCMKERFPQNEVSIEIAGPLTTASAVRKPELILRDINKNKERLHQLLNYSVKSTLAWVDAVCKEFGPSEVTICDPVASMSLINIKQFDEFSKPYLKDLIDGIVEISGIPPVVHICGKSKAIWKPIVDLGVSTWSIDNCEDIEEAKDLIGDYVAIAGNIPPVEIMKYGNIDDVVESVKECIKKGSDSPKGYILWSGCEIPMGTPKENLYAYIYAAKKYGRGAQIGKICKGVLEEVDNVSTI
jgi:MtaA/CmuA family methyltransferase